MYRLACFGAATVKSPAGEEIHFRSRKHLGLLVYLCAHSNRSVGRERLAELFWETEESLARHSLSQALYDLKRRLGPLHVHARGGLVRIGVGQVVYEATELEECLRSGDLSRGVELYRGEFAPNLQSVGTRKFQRWLEGERTRFTILGQLALRKFVEACDRQGRWGEVCLAALRLVKLDPLDEGAHRALMRALWLQGDQHSALQHYADVEDFLVRELPGGPSSETLQLVERIRSSRPPAAGAARRVEGELPLVGRAREFEVLRQALQRVREGNRGVVLVKGEAGIGKTRLLEELRRLASVEGLSCLESRCYSAESDVAYGPVLDAVEPIARDVAAELPEGERRYHQLGHLFPGLFESSLEDEADSVDPAVRRRRLFEEVADLLRRAARSRPLVWILEDIQWIDSASASLLHYACRRLEGEPLLLLLSLRTGDQVREAARRVSEESAAQLGTEMVELEPLSADAIRELLNSASTASTDRVAFSLAERCSGGNPFYALEILRAASGVGRKADPPLAAAFISDPLRNLLTLRLRGLSSKALRILEAVAVLERHATPDNVAAVAGLTPEGAAELAGDLRNRQLLRDAGERIEFAHDIAREFVYSNLGLLQRAALHLTVGEVLARDEEVSPATLARHFEQGGDHARVYEFAMRAAEASASSSAHSEASTMAALAGAVAASSADQYRAERLQAEAELAAGHFEAAQRHFRSILASYPELSPEAVVSIRLSIAKASVESSDWNAAREALRLVEAELTVLPDERLRLERKVETLALLLKVAILTQDDLNARKTNDEIRRLSTEASAAGTLTPVAQAEALCSQVVYATFFESSERAARLLGGLKARSSILPTQQQQKILLLSAVVAIRSARWDEAEVALRRGLGLAAMRKDVINEANITNNLACLSLERGDWGAAEEHCCRSLELLSSISINQYSCLPPLMNLAATRFYTADLPGAESLYEQALAISSARADLHIRAETCASLGLIAAQQGSAANLGRNWASLLELGDTTRIGAQERFKVHWFFALVLSLQGSGAGSEVLLKAAEEERLRDLVSYLKLLWLHRLLFVGEATTQTDSAESLAQRLKEKGLGWFLSFSRRWLTITRHHWPDLLQAPQVRVLRRFPQSGSCS